MMFRHTRPELDIFQNTEAHFLKSKFPFKLPLSGFIQTRSSMDGKYH